MMFKNTLRLRGVKFCVLSVLSQCRMAQTVQLSTHISSVWDSDSNLDPDWHQSQLRTCICDFLPENFSILSKIHIITSLPLLRKEKHCKLALLWINENIFPPYFPTCVKLGVEFACKPASFDTNRIRIWIGIKIEIRIQIGIKTMLCHSILHEST